MSLRAQAKQSIDSFLSYDSKEVTGDDISMCVTCYIFLMDSTTIINLNPKVGATSFIAIDGRGCSGKSTLAEGSQNSCMLKLFM